MIAVFLAICGSGVFAVDPLPIPQAEAGVSPEFAGHVASLLSDGFASTRQSLKAAEQHYQAAKRLRPDDPHLEYAYGLVLLRNLKHAEAIARFREAAAASEPSFPAARARIREMLRKKEYTQAIDELNALADIVNRPVDRDPDGSDPVETARWMGLAFGFLTGPHLTDTIRQHAATADAAISERLRPPYREHYGLGKQDVLIIEGQLQIEQQSAEASAKLKQQAEEQQSAARRESYQARQEELLKTREQWDAWFADRSRALDTQLDQLGDRFDTLNRSVTSLIESIQAAQLDLQRLQTIADMRARRRPGSDGTTAFPVAGTLEAQLLSRSQELNIYVNELSAAMTQRDLTGRQAQGVLAQRGAIEQQYRDATGEVTRKVSRVQQWDTRLKSAMEQANNVPASSRKLRLVANRAQSFSTYDSFDIDVEQQRLLDKYGRLMN
ncbi:MAG: hypothetical protein AB7U20_10530 [Planctomycetaceae bacterium]